MTRQKAAALLDGIPGLRVPRIERYRRDLSRFGAIAADVVARFSYPVIVRHVAADSSSKSQQTAQRTATLAQEEGAMRRSLAGVDWPQFYVIQYADLRKPDGNSRKLRAAFIGDEIIMSRYQFAPGWLVGGQAGPEFYRRFPDRVADIRRGLDDPETDLGPSLMPVPREVRARVPLDLFGMDFDIGEDGRLVLFEAQATMTLLPTPEAPDRAIAPRGPGRRILRAFSRLVRSRLDASAGA